MNRGVVACHRPGAQWRYAIVREEVTMYHPVEVSISCTDCVRRATPDCQDCLVSFVIGGPPGELALEGRDVDVVRWLSDEGLVPSLRYRPGTTL